MVESQPMYDCLKGIAKQDGCDIVYFMYPYGQSRRQKAEVTIDKNANTSSYLSSLLGKYPDSAIIRICRCRNDDSRPALSANFWYQY